MLLDSSGLWAISWTCCSHKVSIWHQPPLPSCYVVGLYLKSHICPDWNPNPGESSLSHCTLTSPFGQSHGMLKSITHYSFIKEWTLVWLPAIYQCMAIVCCQKDGLIMLSVDPLSSWMLPFNLYMLLFHFQCRIDTNIFTFDGNL